MVSDVVEKVVTEKALPPNHYALYLVLGDSESHRVLSFIERLLAVLCSTGSECFLCLKLNAFGETLKQYVSVFVVHSALYCVLACLFRLTMLKSLSQSYYK